MQYALVLTLVLTWIFIYLSEYVWDPEPWQQNEVIKLKWVDQLINTYKENLKLNV